MKTFKTLVSIIAMLAFFGLDEAKAQWATSGTHIYNTNTGNVGIGTNAPSTLLHVGKFMTEPTIAVQNLGSNGGATYSMVDNASGANWKFKATNSGGFKIRDHANSLDVIMIEANSAANSLYIRSGGSVGIGTASPTPDYKLSVIQGTGRAIYGQVTGAGSTAIAVYGHTSATTGLNFAVYGSHYSNQGAAGSFTANNTSGACAGVKGVAFGNVYPASCGVAGYHFSGGIGVGAWSYGGDLIRGYSGDYPGGTLRFYVTNYGLVYADAGFNTFKKTQSASGAEEYRTFNSIQATECRIEDFGSAALLNGEATVSIDPVFAQTVDLQGAYQVFLTPVSEDAVCLFITDKNTEEFVVKGKTLDGRPASCSFDYRIVAKDAENPDARMEVVDIPAPVKVPRMAD